MKYTIAHVGQVGLRIGKTQCNEENSKLSEFQVDEIIKQCYTALQLNSQPQVMLSNQCEYNIIIQQKFETTISEEFTVSDYQSNNITGMTKKVFISSISLKYAMHISSIQNRINLLLQHNE